MNNLLPSIELDADCPAMATVILLHGLGADGNDFVPLVKELALPKDRPVRFIFPHAPVRPVSINNGYAMRSWYDLGMIAGQITSKEEDIRASAAAVNELIARERERGIAAEKIFLAGFSQGGVIALHTALRYPLRLGGVIALSTYLALADSLAKESSEANAALPIFYAHGRNDNVIPLAMALRSREELKRLGYAVEWHEYPMQHSVCPEEIEALQSWLQKLL